MTLYKYLCFDFKRSGLTAEFVDRCLSKLQTLATEATVKSWRSYDHQESVRQMRSRRPPRLLRPKVEQYLKPLEIPHAELALTSLTPRRK